MPAAELKIAGTLKLLMSEIDEPHVLVTLTYDRFTITCRGDDMAYTLPADKQVQVQVKYVDRNGNPAVVDGEVTWSSSDANIADVTADAADTTKATVAPGLATGQAQIVATADADLGEGVR